jgi:hypothetical protein
MQEEKPRSRRARQYTRVAFRFTSTNSPMMFASHMLTHITIGQPVGLKRPACGRNHYSERGLKEKNILGFF